jgi:hypothetical protein
MGKINQSHCHELEIANYYSSDLHYSNHYIVKLQWVNGLFENAIFIHGADGLNYTMDAEKLRAFRELMQEVVTATNNPPVGCEPV